MSEAPPIDPDAVLDLRGIRRQFGTDPAVHALAGVDLMLKRGDWLSITGPSGAGKSTLLNIIGCLDRPTSGVYLIDGVDTTTLTDKQRTGLRAHRIGFVFQSFHLLPYRSVLENVMLAEVYRRHPFRGRRERALAAIERVGLGHRADFSPLKLSGGERQRVAIGRALLMKPRLLLLDEPLASLDRARKQEILPYLARLRDEAKVPMIYVSHQAGEIQRLCSQVVRIEDGQVAAAGGLELLDELRS